MIDPHKILGLQPNATQEEIKKAYKKLAKKHHPDLNQGSKEAEQKFKELNEAYSILTNKTQAQPDAQPFAFHDFFDGSIFESMFGNTFHMVNQIAVDPILFVEGGYFDYTINEHKLVNGRPVGNKKTVRINLEPDTAVGTKLVVPNTANHVIQLIPGNTATYRIKDSVHLVTTKTIDVFLAMMGGTIEINAPGGKILKTKVAPGSKAGTIFRLPGYGLRLLNGVRGELLVEIDLSIPVITNEEELLSKYRDINKG